MIKRIKKDDRFYFVFAYKKPWSFYHIKGVFSDQAQAIQYKNSLEEYGLCYLSVGIDGPVDPIHCLSYFMQCSEQDIVTDLQEVNYDK